MKNRIVLKIFVTFILIFIGILDIHAKECTYLGSFSFTITFNDSTKRAEKVESKNDKDVVFYGFSGIAIKLKNDECPVVYGLPSGDGDYLMISDYANPDVSTNWSEFTPANDLDTNVNCKYSTDDGHNFTIQFNKDNHYMTAIINNDISVKNTNVGLRYNGTCPDVNYRIVNGELYFCATSSNCKTANKNGSTNPGSNTKVCKYYDNGDFIEITFKDGKIQPNSIKTEKHYNSHTFIGDENKNIGIGNDCPTMYFYVGRFIGQDGNFLCYSYEKPANGICKSDAEQSERWWVKGGTQGSYDPNTDTFTEDPGWGDFTGITNEGNLSCEEILGKGGVKLLHDAFLLMKIAAPILFIALNMLDFMKGISGDAKREMNVGFNHIVIRSVCCALLYLLPYLLNVIFKLAGIIAFDSCGIV